MKTIPETSAGQPVAALDIGGVCISLNPRAVADALHWTSMEHIPAEFLAACRQLEQGAVSEEAWLAQFLQISGNRFSRGELIEIWNRILGPALPGMPEAVRTLADEGLRFVYFSNTSRIHMNAFFSRNEFCHLVTGGVFSYEEGVLKPSHRIYEVFEQLYGKPLIYFDDREENILAAKHRNWNAVQFRNAEMFLQSARAAREAFRAQNPQDAGGPLS